VRPIILALVLSSLSLSACAIPEGMNDHCEWPHEQSFVLDLQDPGHRRHLIDDVRVAEELGVRFHDTYLNRGHGRPEWPQTRDGCDAKLFEVIARTHHVADADVRHARARLAQQWDPAMYFPLAALYVTGAFTMARWIRKRFACDEKVASLVAALFASVVLSGSVLALGHLWGGAVEMLRLGNTHMTYRADRLGWHGYASVLFVAGVVLFLAGMVIDRGIRPRSNNPNDLEP
jgi:hypothetical protein